MRMSRILSFFGNRRSNVFNPFSLDLWDPFEGFSGTNLPPSAQETSEAHAFKVDVPGLKKEEVKVEDSSILQICGERSLEKGDKDETCHRVERSSDKFLRRFRLPENSKLADVKAVMENGVLTVTVPKYEPVKKSEVQAIDISG